MKNCCGSAPAGVAHDHARGMRAGTLCRRFDATPNEFGDMQMPNTSNDSAARSNTSFISSPWRRTSLVASAWS